MILNPVSGNRKSFYLDKYIRKYFDLKQFDYNIVHTKYAGHGYKIALDATFDGYKLVVVAGGDGMINEVAHGLANSNTVMGIIPNGSGNGLARHLEIPLNPVKAIEVLNRFNTSFMDTYIINKKGFFCNMAGVGFDALVAQKFANGKKRRFITYLRIILKEFISYKPHNYYIKIDNRELSLKAFIVSFANSSQFGNNAVIAPKASVKDGMINVCIMKSFKWYQAPYIGFMLLTGRIDKTSFMTFFKAKDVKIKMFDANYCHLDGDPYEFGNVINIKPNEASLKIVTP